MVTMDTLVLTKGVPDFREGKVSFDEDGHLERGKTPTVMNPNDEHALQAALQTRVQHGGNVALMSMGPPGYKEVLQEGMRDCTQTTCIVLSDREMGAADTCSTAMTVATGLQNLEEQPDLVFAGFKTADGDTVPYRSTDLLVSGLADNHPCSLTRYRRGRGHRSGEATGRRRHLRD